MFRSMFPNCVPWKICRCAAGFFEILFFYTSFQRKLSKCCHEVMVDNVGDHVMLPKKVVVFKKKVITFLVATCATPDQCE